MSVQSATDTPMADATVAWREILNRRKLPALALVCMGVWLHAADALIVATMMPAIVGDLGGAAFVPWTVSLYELGSIVAGAVSALIAMKAGLRGPMTAGALLFGLGCLLSAVAPTMATLLAGRLLQGFGGGGLTALSFIAVTALFEIRLMARVMAAVSVLWGASAFFGPLIGGAFVAAGSWRLGFVFFALQAFALALWVLAARIDGKGAIPQDSGLVVPVRRLGLLAAGVLSIASAGISFHFPSTPLLLPAGCLSVAGFLWLDSRSASARMLPQRTASLKSPIGAALIMSFAFAIASMGFGTYGALFMVIIHGAPAIVAGYILALGSIGWTLSAFALSGWPESRDRMAIRAGGIIIALSLAVMIQAVPHGPLWLIGLAAFAEGFGFGASWTFVRRRMQRLAPPEDVARMAAALPTVSRFGYALGAALNGVVASAAGFSLDAEPQVLARVAFWLLLANLPVALFGLFAMLRFTAFPGARQGAES